MMCMRSLTRLIGTGTCAAVLFVVSASPLAGQDDRTAGSFRGMDRDGDGVIIRTEWRGNDRSFRNQDRNRDGVLSGEELRGVEDEAGTWSGSGGFADWTEARFANLDRDRDGAIGPGEWSFDRELFERVDHDNDRRISRGEFLGLEYGGSEAWTRDADETGTSDRFEAFDRNRDGVVAMNEWPRSEAAFRRRDTDGSGALSRNEFPAGPARQNEAYHTGYERGLEEGRQAGREDRQGPNRWDLEGQRELEQADSGYTSGIGRREDYQSGYRAGFRVGYEEGFNRR